MMLPEARPLSDGLVIMFEGIDGVGKTVQLELAREALEKAGWPVFATRNMGGTPIGEALREVIKSPLERPPLTDFYASLAIQEPLLSVIKDARSAGKIVLMDRGPLSLAAYQIYGAGIDEAMGWRHVERGMKAIEPEIIILYDMDVKVALERIPKHKKEHDYFDKKPLSYFNKVAEGFHKSVRRYPEAVVIDASDPVAEVHEQTMRAVAGLLK